MKRVILAVCILLSGCSKEDKQANQKDDFISQIKDQAYLGTAKSKMYLNGEDPLRSIEGTASLSADNINGDSLTLSIVVELPEGDGFTLGIPGKQQGKAWQALLPNGTFAIEKNGSMSGRVSDGEKEISWGGNLGGDYAIFDVRIKYTVDDGNIPASSILVTQFDLSRFIDGAANNETGCEQIIWQIRPVFNLYSGGVDLISVPVCH